MSFPRVTGYVWLRHWLLEELCFGLSIRAWVRPSGNFAFNITWKPLKTIVIFTTINVPAESLDQVLRWVIFAFFFKVPGIKMKKKLAHNITWKPSKLDWLYSPQLCHRQWHFLRRQALVHLNFAIFGCSTCLWNIGYMPITGNRVWTKTIISEFYFPLSAEWRRKPDIPLSYPHV